MPPTVDIEMNIQQKLDVIREYARDIREGFSESKYHRIPEIRSMLNSILDRVMQIEYEILGME
jgi:hypothetical protein